MGVYDESIKCRIIDVGASEVSASKYLRLVFLKTASASLYMSLLYRKREIERKRFYLSFRWQGVLYSVDKSTYLSLILMSAYLFVIK